MLIVIHRTHQYSIRQASAQNVRNFNSLVGVDFEVHTSRSSHLCACRMVEIHNTLVN